MSRHRLGVGVAAVLFILIGSLAARTCADLWYVPSYSDGSFRREYLRWSWLPGKSSRPSRTYTDDEFRLRYRELLKSGYRENPDFFSHPVFVFGTRDEELEQELRDFGCSIEQNVRLETMWVVFDGIGTPPVCHKEALKLGIAIVHPQRARILFEENRDR